MKIELTLAQKNLPVVLQAEVNFLLRLLPDSVRGNANYPIDARFVLDHSGSMDEPADGGMTKMQALKQAVEQAIDVFRVGKDQIGIVIFDDNMEVIFDSAVLTDVAKIKNIIKRIKTGDNTHLSSPLRWAIEAPVLKGALSKIIIFTDGIVNHPSENSEIRSCYALAREANKAGIPFSVFGTGVSYNEKFLKQLAELAGRGSYFEHVSQVGKVAMRLLDDFENLKSVQERDIKVVIEAAKDCVIKDAVKYVPQQADMLQNGKVMSDDFQGLDVRGQSYLLKMKIDAKEAVGDFKVAKATVSWVGISGPETQTMDVAVNFTTDPALISPVNKTVLNTALNTEAVRATILGQTQKAETLFTKTGNKEMLETLKTLSKKEDEDKKRELKTLTATKAHATLQGGEK